MQIDHSNILLVMVSTKVIAATKRNSPDKLTRPGKFKIRFPTPELPTAPGQIIFGCNRWSFVVKSHVNFKHVNFKSPAITALERKNRILGLNFPFRVFDIPDKYFHKHIYLGCHIQERQP